MGSAGKATCESVCWGPWQLYFVQVVLRVYGGSVRDVELETRKQPGIRLPVHVRYPGKVEESINVNSGMVLYSEWD